MTGHVYIYGEIGSQVTVSDVQKQLAGIGNVDEIEVHIVSVGGDVFEGYGIYNILKNTGAKITTMVEGLCASIATLIAAAGTEIVMNKTSQFMIHNPQIGGLSGDAEDLRNAADQLDKIKNMFIDIYEAKTGLSRDALWKLYDNETWMTADEALKLGFVDSVLHETIKAVATADLKNLNHIKAVSTEKETLLTKILNKLNLLDSKIKIKNMIELALADGTAIVVEAEQGEDPTGKRIMTADGQPLPAGDYSLADGTVITVAEDSTITTVTAPTSNQEEEMKAQVDALQAQVAELTNKLAAAEKAKTTLAAQAETFKNVAAEVQALKTELESLKTTTAGDPAVPAPGFKNFGDQVSDPMADAMNEYLTSRNFKTSK